MKSITIPAMCWRCCWKAAPWPQPDVTPIGDGLKAIGISLVVYGVMKALVDLMRADDQKRKKQPPAKVPKPRTTRQREGEVKHDALLENLSAGHRPARHRRLRLDHRQRVLARPDPAPGGGGRRSLALVPVALDQKVKPPVTTGPTHSNTQPNQVRGSELPSASSAGRPRSRSAAAAAARSAPAARPGPPVAGGARTGASPSCRPRRHWPAAPITRRRDGVRRFQQGQDVLILGVVLRLRRRRRVPPGFQRPPVAAGATLPPCQVDDHLVLVQGRRHVEDVDQEPLGVAVDRLGPGHPPELSLLTPAAPGRGRAAPRLAVLPRTARPRAWGSAWGSGPGPPGPAPGGPARLVADRRGRSLTSFRGRTGGAWSRFRASATRTVAQMCLHGSPVGVK